MMWPFKKKETRSTNQAAGGDSYWADFEAIRTGSVNPTTAQSVSTVYACVSAISETIGSLPLHLYERGSQRTKARKHPLYEVLHDAPNEHQNALEFREMMTAHILLRGNAFAKIMRDGSGQVRQLIPLHPERVSIHKTSNGVLYETTDDDGKVQRLLPSEVFHLRHRADGDALVGVSPIQAARDVIQLSISEREHGNAVFTNGTKLSGILKFTGALRKDQIDKIRESWTSNHTGARNFGKVPILESGVEYQPISMTLEDAEWIAARKFSVEEVARIFRVPPTIIGDLTHGNFSNSVEMTRMFVTLTLRRHLVEWEQAISRQLLSAAGRTKYKPEHSVEGLLRGDATNRAAFYKSGIDAGWLLVSEARELENLPALDDHHE